MKKYSAPELELLYLEKDPLLTSVGDNDVQVEDDFNDFVLL